jgi:CRISPR-associated protein Csd1
MILQALYQLAENERLLEDPDFEWKPIAWIVTVDDGGRFLGITGTHVTPEAPEGSKKKPRPQAKSFPVPREEGRTSGDRAFFLFDKSEYALGLDTETDPAKARPAEKLAARFGLFRQGVEDCLAATGDPGVGAVAAFLRQLAEGSLTVALPPECASNDLFTFLYHPDIDTLVTERPAVKEYWRGLRARSAGAAEGGVACLVTGRPCEPVGKHPGIKNIPGGSTSGIALVSFNSNAFESYGWSGNDNAPVSREAAEAVSTALNRLFHPAFPDPVHPGQTLPRLSLRLSENTAVCFWSPAPRGDDVASALLALLDANPDAVRELYRSLWKGESAAIEDPAAFYALTVSGSQGRAILRDWLETSVREVAEHLADHFRDLAIVRNTPPPKGKEHPPALPLRVLLRSLAVRGADKEIPAALSAQFVHAALKGNPYPLAVLQRALERSRAEIGGGEWSDLERRDARAALLKAVLNRRRRFHLATTAYPEVTESMDPTNPNPGYRLGRLMAVLERMQQLALGDVNASVVDRFFSSASASPAAVFPRLLRGFRHHSRKARDEDKGGLASDLENESDAVLADLRTFPPFLPLEQQALFVLGYHHERPWLYLSRAERARRIAEATAATAPQDEADSPNLSSVESSAS